MFFNEKHGNSGPWDKASISEPLCELNSCCDNTTFGKEARKFIPTPPSNYESYGWKPVQVPIMTSIIQFLYRKTYSSLVAISLDCQQAIPLMLSTLSVVFPLILHLIFLPVRRMTDVQLSYLTHIALHQPSMSSVSPSQLLIN